MTNAATKALAELIGSIEKNVNLGAYITPGFDTHRTLQVLHSALAALSADPAAVEPTPEINVLQRARLFVDAATTRSYDGTNGNNIRHEAVLTLALIDAVLATQPVAVGGHEPFQVRVSPWMQACFGPEISRDTSERNHRFLEEALELVQACGCTAHEAHQLVDYTFGRLLGDPEQEVGGVMVTLAALCLAQGFDMHTCGETELARIWTKVDAIRAKQAAKPKHSPLPIHPTPKAGESS